MQKLFDVIIPIRSKSKELKNKNILPFSGKTILVNYTIKKILNIKEIRRIYVLTDSAKYKKKLIKHKKIDSSYLRKKKFSKANSKINDLIKDFILHYYPFKDNQNLLILQVTSPTLSVNEINKTLKFIKKNNPKSLMHVCNVIESPYEIVEKKSQKKWNFLIKKRIINRQNYKRVFQYITGSLFFFNTNFFKKYKKIYNLKTTLYLVDKINFLDIDDKLTFDIAKKVSNLKIRK
tara:strand:+ start:2781 stop:3482 length:702 start_codon:yes stop_codon:yes gene_type:complete